MLEVVIKVNKSVKRHSVQTAPSKHYVNQTGRSEYDTESDARDGKWDPLRPLGIRPKRTSREGRSGEIVSEKMSSQCGAVLTADRSTTELRWNFARETGVYLALEARSGKYFVHSRPPTSNAVCVLRNRRDYFNLKIAGWSSLVARQAHNLKAAGSNPAPATNLFRVGSSLVFPPNLSSRPGWCSCS
jgi:hypothetical protein